jgi:hypothetical protein
MSTELATIPESEFLAVRGEDNAVAEALEANQEELSVRDLIRVRVPAADSGQWSIKDPANVRTAKEIVGALVVYRKGGVLWPTEGEAIKGSRPVIVTNDLRTGQLVSDDFGDLDEAELQKARIEDGPNGELLYDWLELSYNKWGSSGKGRGKRCKERRILGILEPESMYPLIVTVPPASLRNVTDWIKGMSLNGIPHFRLVCALGLEEVTNDAGQEFCKVVPRTERILSEEEGSFLRERFTNPLNSALAEQFSWLDENDSDE